MFDISSPETINSEFSKMVDLGFGPENRTVKMFGVMFWKDLNEANRKAYHWVWPPMKMSPYRSDGEFAESINPH